MSYADPGSPSDDSSASSPSSQPDELHDEPVRQTWTSALANAFGGATSGPGAGKRRLAGGSTARDAKTRRRDEGGLRRQTTAVSWGEGKPKGEKEELVDVQLAEKLRKGECAHVTSDLCKSRYRRSSVQTLETRSMTLSSSLANEAPLVYPPL